MSLENLFPLASGWPTKHEVVEVNTSKARIRTGPQDSSPFIVLAAGDALASSM